MKTDVDLYRFFYINGWTDVLI